MVKVFLIVVMCITAYFIGKHQGYNEGLQDADFETVDCGFFNSEGEYIEDLQQVDKREIKDVN